MIPKEKLSRFFRSISLLFGSGIGLFHALEHLSADDDAKFAVVVEDLASKLSHGHSFSFAVREHPKVFPRICADMIEAGEKSGTLNAVLDQLAEYLSRGSALEQRLIAAMVYPVIVFLLMLGMGLGMAWFVFPREREFLESLDAEIPALTKAVFLVFEFAFHPLVLVALVSSLVLGFVLYSGREEKNTQGNFKELTDEWILKLPVIGEFLLKLSVSRALTVLSMLLQAGLMVDKSLLAAGRMLGNTKLEKELHRAVHSLHRGKSLAEALDETHCFPSLVVQLFEVGQETGKLHTVSAKLAEVYEEELDSALAGFVSLVEPIALLIVGTFVGVLLLATLLPTTNVVGNL